MREGGEMDRKGPPLNIDIFRLRNWAKNKFKTEALLYTITLFGENLYFNFVL